jgi:hypothetical protein
MGQYKPMFNISMEHTYFSDGKLTGVELVPTAESAKIMSNANLVLRKRQDGVTVFFDNDYIDALRLYAEDETDPLRLNFECEIDNSNLLRTKPYSLIRKLQTAQYLAKSIFI